MTSKPRCYADCLDDSQQLYQPFARSRLYYSLYIWVKYGPQANGLFTMGYNIYAWFLLISTAGVPVAVAKQVINTIPGTKDHSFALIRAS